MRVPARQQADDTPQIGSVIADKYRLERVLGSSGMGTVFSSLHLMTGRRAALRWMNAPASEGAEGLERFIREFQVAAGIVHANVAEVLDAGTQGGGLYIVLEYLEGEPLAARVARGPMPASECVPIVVQAMQGIAAGHRLGVVHRDLRPENIFICMDPEREGSEIKVLDFGVMQAANACASRPPTFADLAAAVGTPAYMAPEQVLGQSAQDLRVDVYALGVILYHALSGRPPFSAETGTRLLERIAAGSPPPLWSVAPLLPDGLSKVVMRALQRDPERRYPSVDDFAAALFPWAPDLDLWPSTMLSAELVDPGIYGISGPITGSRDSGARLRELSSPTHPEREERRLSLDPAREDLRGLDVAIVERHEPNLLDEGPWSDKTERVRLRSRFAALSESSILLIVAGCFVFATAWGLLVGLPNFSGETRTPPAAETQPSAATDLVPSNTPARASEPQPPSEVLVVSPAPASEPSSANASEPNPPELASELIAASPASSNGEPSSNASEPNSTPQSSADERAVQTHAAISNAAAEPALAPKVQPTPARVGPPEPPKTAEAPASNPVRQASAPLPAPIQAAKPPPPAPARPLPALSPAPTFAVTPEAERMATPAAKPGRKTSGVSLSDF